MKKKLLCLSYKNERTDFLCPRVRKMNTLNQLATRVYLAISPTPVPTQDVNDLAPVKTVYQIGAIFAAIVSGIGIIIIIKNVMELGPAIQQQDSGTVNSAIKGIVGGAIMAAVTGILAFLGFTI